MTASDRRSFQLRLQPYEGSLLAEVVDYLNSLDRSVAQRKLEAALMMCFLAQARLYADHSTPEELRRTCLECCDSLDKHASYLRQLMRVEPPWLQAPIGQLMPQARTVSAVDPAAANRAAEQAAAAQTHEETSADADEPQPVPKPQLEGDATAAQVNSLFGD